MFSISVDLHIFDGSADVYKPLKKKTYIFSCN